MFQPPPEDDGWVNIIGNTQEYELQGSNPELNIPSDSLSMDGLEFGGKSGEGIILNAGREVRVKLYAGQVRLFHSQAILLALGDNGNFIRLRWAGSGSYPCFTCRHFFPRRNHKYRSQ